MFKDYLENKSTKAFMNNVFPFVFLFVLLLIIFWNPKELGVTGDEHLYAASVSEKGFFYHSLDFYNRWTSRTLIELVLASFALLPTYCWSIVNSLICTLAAFSITRLIPDRKPCINWVVSLLFLSINWLDFSNAGWIATTVNYVWPTTLGIFSLIPFAEYSQEKKSHIALIIATIPALIFSVNMEQNLVFHILFVLGYIAFHIIQKKKVFWLIYVHAAASVASLFYTMLSPGVSARFDNEIVVSFADWEMRDTIRNIELALTSSTRLFLFSAHLQFVFFALLLAIFVFIKNKNVFYRMIGLVPVITTLGFGFYQEYTLKVFPILSFIPHSVTTEGIITFANSTNPPSFIPLLVVCAALSATIIAIYIAFGHTKASVIAMFAFCACFSTLAAIGFSPTVWSSARRTSFIFCMGLIFLSAMLFNRIYKNKRLTYPPILFLGIYTMINYITLLDS